MSELARREPGASLSQPAIDDRRTGDHGELLLFRQSAGGRPEADDDRAVGMAGTAAFIARLSDVAGDKLGFGALRSIQLSGNDRTSVTQVRIDGSGQHELRGALTFQDIEPADLADRIDALLP